MNDNNRKSFGNPIIKKHFYPYLQKQTIEHILHTDQGTPYLTSLSTEDGNYDLAQDYNYCFSEDYITSFGQICKIHPMPSNRYLYGEFGDLLAKVEGRKPVVLVNDSNYNVITLEECQKCNILPDWCIREDDYCQGTKCPYRYRMVPHEEG